jgi:succinate dehydrogenase / fumarate reductase cytochrome b subunit
MKKHYNITHLTDELSNSVFFQKHLVVLSTLSRGPGSWDAFISLARQPYFLVLDVVLLAGILIHGLNGLRVTLMGFDVGVKKQKALFSAFMLVAVVALSAAALKIFGG